MTDKSASRAHIPQTDSERSTSVHGEIDAGDVLVTVCAQCLTASCWHGDFMCQYSDTAGIIKIRRNELREMDLEHPDYFSDEELLRVCGSIEREHSS